MARRIRRRAGAFGKWLSHRKDPLRTGVFGVFIVVCLVLISFGYTWLPFWPQGRAYTPISPTRAVSHRVATCSVSGIKVGKVTDRGALAGDLAPRWTSPWTAMSPSATSRWRPSDRHHAGAASARGDPGGCRARDGHPVGPDHDSVHAELALQDLGENAANLDKQQLNRR